jgi:lipid II:glycine glycyltransferase (peptidoglycan interpeptide bridge formation enzyme)
MQTLDTLIQKSDKSSCVEYTTIKFYENRIDVLQTQLEETKSDLSHISTLFIEEKQKLQKMTKRFHMSLRENENLKKRIQELEKKL